MAIAEAVTFQSPTISIEPRPTYNEVLEDPQVRGAKSIYEQDKLILTKLGMQHVVVFDASLDQKSFEAENQRAMQELNKVRVEKERVRNLQRQQRLKALHDLDARGYSFKMLLKPPRF